MENAVMVSDKPLKEGCDCTDCRSLCRGNPGWFLPNEAKKAAEYLETSLEEFFEEHLIVEYWVQGFRHLDVLAPKREAQRDRKYARWSDAFLADSPCSLLGEHGCSLPLEVRPHECATTFAPKCSKESEDDDDEPVRSAIAEAWQEDPAEMELVMARCFD